MPNIVVDYGATTDSWIDSEGPSGEEVPNGLKSPESHWETPKEGEVPTAHPFDKKCRTYRRRCRP